MSTIRHLLETKGSQIFTIRPTESVLEATQVMNKRGVGALVVMDGRRVVGMLTERDVLRRVVGEELMPAAVRVEEVMTRDVICCSPDTPIDEASGILRDKRIRHLPVCNEEGKLIGLISIGDLNAYHASSQQAQIHFLNEYVYGRA